MVANLSDWFMADAAVGEVFACVFLIQAPPPPPPPRLVCLAIARPFLPVLGGVLLIQAFLRLSFRPVQAFASFFWPV